MDFFKKNYLIIIFFALIVVIIGLTIKCINSNPVVITPPDNFYNYAQEKFRQDSLTIEALEFSHFKALTEAKHSREVSDSLIAVIRGFKPNKQKEELKSLPIAEKQSRLRGYLMD